ncbi:MAG TPA: terminase small subunit [Luteimonas sp.]
MAAKMTKAEWAKARRRWEAEEDPGYQWLVTAMGLPVTPQAVGKRAREEGWEKNPVKITERAAMVAMQDAKKAEKAAKLASETPEIVPVVEEVVSDDLVNRFGLTAQQALHAREFMADYNPFQSAIRAGYSEATAKSKSSEMVSAPKFQSAVAYLMRSRLEKMGRDADELVAFHLQIIDFDPNTVCELRVHACKYCWGVDHAMQHDPQSWQKEREKFEKRWQKMSESEQKLVGEFPAVPPDGWYEAKRGPNDDCPQCHGVGIEVVKWKDTRQMPPNIRRMFGGIKMNKEGLEVVMLQKAASLATLSSHLGLNKVAEVQVNTAIVTETAKSFEAIMAEARERQRSVLIERGILQHEGSGG